MMASPPCLCSGAFTPDRLRDQKSTGSAVKLGPLTPMNEITTSATFAVAICIEDRSESGTKLGGYRSHIAARGAIATVTGR